MQCAGFWFTGGSNLATSCADLRCVSEWSPDCQLCESLTFAKCEEVQACRRAEAGRSEGTVADVAELGNSSCDTSCATVAAIRDADARAAAHGAPATAPAETSRCETFAAKTFTGTEQT